MLLSEKANSSQKEKFNNAGKSSVESSTVLLSVSDTGKRKRTEGLFYANAHFIYLVILVVLNESL